MTDWEIIRIKDDPMARDTERWTIVYSVPVEYAPDGVFSASMPKAWLNTYAVAYEYDVNDPGQLGDMFDHVMTMPMLTAPTLGTPANNSMATLMTSTDPVGKMLAKSRQACHGRDAYLRHPDELKAEIKAGIDEMKSGVAHLKAASQVELVAPGTPTKLADPSENPKYIVMRDMVSRLRPDMIALGLEKFREQRAFHMAHARRNGAPRGF